MEITSKTIEKHGLKPEEYDKIKKLLKRSPNFLELGIFQPCGTNTAHTNPLEFI